MPRGRPGTGAKKPHAATKAAARVLSPDEVWADEVDARVLADAHPYQAAPIACTHRFITLRVGRGGGKTTVKKARAIRKMARIRGGRIVYIAPTRPMAEELMWEPLKASLEFYGWMDHFEFNESKLRCRCKRTGATYKLLGMDDKTEVNKLRGQPFDEVQPDEASYIDPKLLTDLLQRAVGPRLGQRKGTVIMGSSPGSILSGPFYRYTRPGSTEPDEDGNPVPLHVPYAELDKHPDWDGYVSFFWNLKQIVTHKDVRSDRLRFEALFNLYDEQLKVKKRERWSDQNPIWLREYMGEWAADDTDTVFRYRAHLDDGAAWNQWDPFGTHKLEGIQALTAAVAKLRAMHPTAVDWRFVVAGDSGSSDPWACNVFAFSPQDQDRRFWHVMPFERTRLYARPFAELLLGPEAVAAHLAGTIPGKYGGVFGVTGWPDGAVLDSDQTTIDELANTYGIQFVKADRNPFSKVGAIELTNGDLVDGRIKIIKDSPLEQQLQTLQWAEDTHGRVKENKAQANHSTDTLVYGRKLAQSLFESGAVAQETTGAPATYVDPQGLDVDAGDPADPEESLADDEFTDTWGG